MSDGEGLIVFGSGTPRLETVPDGTPPPPPPSDSADTDKPFQTVHQGAPPAGAKVVTPWTPKEAAVMLASLHTAPGAVWYGLMGKLYAIEAWRMEPGELDGASAAAARLLDRFAPVDPDKRGLIGLATDGAIVIAEFSRLVAAKVAAAQAAQREHDAKGGPSVVNTDGRPTAGPASAPPYSADGASVIKPTSSGIRFTEDALAFLGDDVYQLPQE